MKKTQHIKPDPCTSAIVHNHRGCNVVTFSLSLDYGLDILFDKSDFMVSKISEENLCAHQRIFLKMLTRML